MNSLAALVLLPIFSGLLIYTFRRRIPKYLGIPVQAGLFALSIYLVVTMGEGRLAPLIDVPLPFGMALGLDSINGLIVILCNGLFLGFMIFAAKEEYLDALFVFLFMTFQGLINGILLSVDFFNIYILIEVATVTVSILIMYKKDSQSMYDAMLYLLVSMVAMAFFLFGIGYLYKIYGTLDFYSIQQMNLAHPASIHLPLALLLTGAGVKAALMPLFGWLPKAHGAPSAPSVVSAALSGIFVKTGVYLMLRMYLLFGLDNHLREYLMFFGFVTSISGFVFAMAQKKIKLILAYHTVSQVGLILVGISGAQAMNMTGGLFHIVAHGVFKGLLFLVAGILVHEYRTHNVYEMKGLWQRSPLLSVALLTGILSITGAPFFSGGYGKYLISYGYEGLGYQILFWIINLGTMISFVKLLRILGPVDRQRGKVRLPLNQCCVLGVMSAVCLGMGIGGEWIAGRFFGMTPGFTLSKQLTKIPEYLIFYGGAFGIYRLFVHHNPLLERLRKVEFSFNGICISMAAFFFLTLSFLKFTP